MSLNPEALDALNALNDSLSGSGLPKLAILNPKDLKGQDVNARYFLPEKFQQLVRNVQRDGRLESTPLVYHDGSQWRIISGHHRILAAKEAGLENVLCLVAEPQDNDEIVSKQLSHNALTGVDDRVLLSQLFNSIADIELKIATGLNSDISSISYTSLNFRLGEYKEFNIMFLPEELEDYDRAIERIATESLGLKSQTELRTTDIAYWDKFAETVRRIKKLDNIKSNGVALQRMVELALESLERYAAQHELDENAGEA